MIAEELKLVIRAEVTNAVANMQKFSSTTDVAKTSAKSLQDRMTSFAKSLLAASGAILSIRALVNVMKSSIAAYREQEQAEAKLAAALRATSKQYDISLKEMTDYASELQRITTYGDEVTVSAMAMLQQLGDLDKQGLKRLTPLVQDFATAMGVDLQTAASLVGKTLGSTTNALSRYGVQIDANAPKEQKLASLIGVLQDKFGGFSEKVAQTGSGALAQLNNIMSDIQEEGGKALLDFLKPAIVDLTNFLTKTLQAWSAQRNLNMALKGQATSVYEIDQALKEQNKRLGDAGILEQNLARQISEAQAAYDKEAKAVREGKDALKSNLPALASRLAGLRAQYDTQKKTIKQGRENIDTLNAEREELQRLNDIESANVRITKAREEAYRVAISQAQALAGNIASLENRNSSAVESFRKTVDISERLAFNLSQMEARYESLPKPIKKTTDELKDFQEKAESAVTAIAPFAEAIGQMAVDSERGWEAFKEAAKDAIASVLRMLAEKAFVESLAAFASLNIPGGILWAAAGTAALVAAGVVKALGEGGVVTGPTQALIGEKGPEAVIPLNKMGGMGTRVNVYVMGSVMEEEGLARKIGYIVSRQRRGY